MGERGPAPTPTPILKMRGSWRAKRNKRQPKSATGRPMCPQWIDARAKSAWKVLVPQLEAMQVLTKVDRNALTRYCQVFATWRHHQEFINKHGTVYPVKDAEGKPAGFKEFPQVAIAMKLADQLLRLEQQFGLTPAARARLQTATEETKSDDEQRKERYFKLG